MEISHLSGTVRTPYKHVSMAIDKRTISKKETFKKEKAMKKEN